MGFLDSLSISASGLTASRLRMDVIAENIANSETTRTPDGETYRRKYVVLQEKRSGVKLSGGYGGLDGGRSFASYLSRASTAGSGGVRVVEVGEDPSELKLDYDPTHPDADEDGYVRYPNIDIVQEMTDMMAAYRSYEANITALNTFKDMAVKTLEIGNG
ncbi:MAG: flagellar basal body rod protein FlgC [Oscillospiraceae bacterium]|jgi:flagellar basal-body rod protein FlgC|nr:flagellar basal body rod protein FlgC [Oscillospiraceae bacterium]